MDINDLSDIVQEQIKLSRKDSQSIIDLAERHSFALCYLKAILQDYSEVVSTLTEIPEDEILKRLTDRAQQIKLGNDGLDLSLN